MTQENKELLLKDLGARLSHGVKGRVYAEVSDGQYDIMGDLIFYNAPFVVTLDEINTSTEEIHVIAVGNEDTVEFIEEAQQDGEPYVIDDFKPYLRPMSSMTEEEKEEFENLLEGIVDGIERWDKPDLCEEYDWLNAHHFDYRRLIEKNLALEAPKDMYK